MLQCLPNEPLIGNASFFCSLPDSTKKGLRQSHIDLRIFGFELEPGWFET